MRMNAKTPGQNRLKQKKDYESQKHLKTLCFEYRVLLYDLGSAEWLRDTIQSLNPSIEILAEC